MDNMPEKLDELGLKFATDKASSGHNYLDLYERYFSAIRDKNVKILEIGVLNGSSLAVWEAYFPNAKIIGADINPATKTFERARVQIEILDQSNIEQLVQLGLKHGPFDVIIEDGSHFWDHQIISLKTLFPFVKSGGTYVVEDLQTNYGTLAASYRGVSTISCVEYLKKLVDLRVADNQIDISEQEDAFIRTYARSMRTITFYRQACVIEKSVPVEADLSIRTPLISVPQDTACVSTHIAVHIGHQGDRSSATGWLRSGKSHEHFQGFSVTVPDEPDCVLLYRARLANAEWTGWKTKGEFAGTRGRAESIIGLTVQLDERSKEKYTLVVVGEFSRSHDLVEVQEGDDCVSPPGGGALIGMQLVLRRSSPLSGL
jgi:23S rRNA U2552 (ribose-2'-O)-methylase RlmE/FtsJ